MGNGSEDRGFEWPGDIDSHGHTHQARIVEARREAQSQPVVRQIDRTRSSDRNPVADQIELLDLRDSICDGCDREQAVDRWAGLRVLPFQELGD